MASLSPHPQPRQWQPRKVLVTASARELPHGRRIMERASALGIPIVELPNDRLALDRPDDPRQAYIEAKATMAVVVAPPSKLKFQPIAPSADWRVDLAAGCPAHCNYCYLAGSLKGPPITRVYANLEQILESLPSYLGQGTVSSRNLSRAHEGTTFEASCYTDPLALEHITGSLSRMIAWFGRWQADVQLRFTTKFSSVDPLLDIEHAGRTRMRSSINPRSYARFEGGTDPVASRLVALRRMAQAGYPIGLTIAPIIAAAGWEQAYGELIQAAATTLSGLSNLDLTIELITHRFTDGSKSTLDSWYPGSKLDMTSNNRSTKFTKFGTQKQVYDADTMRRLRSFFTSEIGRMMPEARILYWT